MGRIQETLCSKDVKKEENESDRKIKEHLKIDLEYLENHHTDHERKMKKRGEKHLGLKSLALKFKNVKSNWQWRHHKSLGDNKEEDSFIAMHLGNKFTERNSFESWGSAWGQGIVGKKSE